MPSLSIRNFLTIHSADVDFKRFTLLIGPQANGKSIIAKAAYFFEKFLTSDYTAAIGTGATKRELERTGIAAFEAIFPRYAWGDGNFSLTYRIDDFVLSITRTSKSKSPVRIDYSPDLAELHRRARSAFKARRSEYENLKDASRRARNRHVDILQEILDEYLYHTPYAKAFPTSVFIPASRSFFANLQKNVFSFLANNIPIDPLIKEFGSAYENAKWFYQTSSVLQRDQATTDLVAEFKRDAESLLRGEYVHEDEQDWIVSKKRRINLANASSGQQEVLPMLVVLLVWSAVFARRTTATNFFIEEPEAHLFPQSQKRIVDMLAQIYQARPCSFILTTHSPYILTALNNLLMAGNLIETYGSDVEPEVKKATGSKAWIPYDDVSAYTVEDGRVRSILDPETGLVGASVIDAVSEEFGVAFERLLDIEAERV